MTFRLLDPPLELREMIYFQITGPYLRPHGSSWAPPHNANGNFVMYFDAARQTATDYD